jgi:hypothetical protein
MLRREPRPPSLIGRQTEGDDAPRTAPSGRPWISIVSWGMGLHCA